MLARKYRLISFPRDKRAQFHKTAYFTLKIIHNALPFSRVGIIVSKKVDKRATRRNSLRRTFRARLEEANVHEVPGRDILIIFTPAIKDHVEAAAKDALTILRT